MGGRKIGRVAEGYRGRLEELQEKGTVFAQHYEQLLINAKVFSNRLGKSNKMRLQW